MNEIVSMSSLKLRVLPLHEPSPDADNEFVWLVDCKKVLVDALEASEDQRRLFLLASVKTALQEAAKLG